jgi:hypothetical protein
MAKLIKQPFVIPEVTTLVDTLARYVMIMNHSLSTP